MAADKPFGLNDIKIKELPSGSAVDLAVAARLSFSEAPDVAELRGDDELAAVHVAEGKLNLELEAGGISLEAWEVLSGGTYATGTGYYQITKQASDLRPYFVLGGKVVDNDNTGDTHFYAFYCKCIDGPGGEFRDGQFFMTSATLEGIDDDSNGIWMIRQNDTAAALDLDSFT
jgi:hypothetical protein